MRRWIAILRGLEPDARRSRPHRVRQGSTPLKSANRSRPESSRLEPAIPLKIDGDKLVSMPYVRTTAKPVFNNLIFPCILVPACPRSPLSCVPCWVVSKSVWRFSANVRLRPGYHFVQHECG